METKTSREERLRLRCPEASALQLRLALLISVGSGHRGLRDSLEEVELVVGRDKSCDYQVPDSGRPLVYAFGARVCGGPQFRAWGF